MIKKSFVLLMCLVFSCSALANTCESELTGNVASFLRLLKESYRPTGETLSTVSISQLERMTIENINPLSGESAGARNAAAKAAFARLSSSLSFEQKQRILAQVAHWLQESHSTERVIREAKEYTASVLAPQAIEAVELEANLGPLKAGSLLLHRNVDGRIWVVVHSIPNGQWSSELNVFAFESLQSRSFTRRKYELRNQQKELFDDSSGNLWLAAYSGTSLNIQNLSTEESLPEYSVQFPIKKVIRLRDSSGPIRLLTVQKTNQEDEYQIEILKVAAGVESQFLIPSHSGRHEFSRTPSGDALVTLTSLQGKLQVWNLTTLNLIAEWDYNPELGGTKTHVNREGQVHVAVIDYLIDRPTMFFRTGESKPIIAVGWNWSSTVDWYETSDGRLLALLLGEAKDSKQEKSSRLRLFEPFNPSNQQVYKNRLDRFVNFFGLDSGTAKLQASPVHDFSLKGSYQSFGFQDQSVGKFLITRNPSEFQTFLVEERKSELVTGFQFESGAPRRDFLAMKLFEKNGLRYGVYNLEDSKVVVSEFSTNGVGTTNQVVFTDRGAWHWLQDGDQIYMANLIGSKLQFATLFGRAK